MNEFKQKNKTGRFISSPVVLAALVLVFGFLLRGVWNIYNRAKISEVEFQISKSKMARLENRENDLMISTERLKTENGVEAEIRDRFHMGKPGEKAIIIVEEDVEDKLAIPENQDFLQKIWNFFTR